MNLFSLLSKKFPISLAFCLPACLSVTSHSKDLATQILFFYKVFDINCLNLEI